MSTSTGASVRARESSYPMVEMDEAISRVIGLTSPLNPVVMHLQKCHGLICAEDVYAREDYPAFPASIMDGYAVNAPCEPGLFTIQQRVHAGDEERVETAMAVQPGFAAYITTGAKLPDGTNAVIKIEDTKRVSESGGSIERVEFPIKLTEGLHVRQIGSDIRKGELILPARQLIKAAEVGLLATAGVTSVLCYPKPIIGVMSTGNELVDPWQQPSGTQIRDSNRAALIAAFEEDGLSCVDFGIVRDLRAELRKSMLAAASRCDVVVSSGGVSMGDADLVKPLLEEIGTVHFGRLNMKPGKPTTFATIVLPSGKTCLFFGLPGNPASCLVCKMLVVDVAVKRLQGLAPEQCLPPQCVVKLNDGENALSVGMDPERPEYHRALLSVDFQSTDASEGGSRLVAQSTGNQRSSRLLSMRSSNALLIIPQGRGVVQPGQTVKALITGSLPYSSAENSFHPKAASLAIEPNPSNPVSVLEASAEPSLLPSSSLSTSASSKRTMTVGLLTISDRASQGIYADESGPTMARLLLEMAADAWPLEPIITPEFSAIVPDEPLLIAKYIKDWCDVSRLDLILTSGGTGFGLRDLTPEAIRPLLQREAPGLAQALLLEGLKHTPLAVLSRPVAGTRGKTFICTLPGSVKAIRENIIALRPLLPRIVELLNE